MTSVTTAPHLGDRPARTLEPQWAEVLSVQQEIADVATLSLRFVDPVAQSSYRFLPGQFNMLYLPGFGEAAISISSDAEDRTHIGHTVRFVGNVTRALSRVRPGDRVGLRGPFGSAWPATQLKGRDVFIACGGIGLPPLRPVICQILRNRAEYGKVTVLYGARTPAELMYTQEYETWRKAGIEVETTVDRAEADWTGPRGSRADVVLSFSARRAQYGCSDLRPGDHDPLRYLRGAGSPHRPGEHLRFTGTQHEMRSRILRSLPDRPIFHLQGWSRVSVRRLQPFLNVEEF